MLGILDEAGDHITVRAMRAMMSKIALRCVLCSAWFAGFGASAYGTSYQIRELTVAGTPAVGPSWANAINDSGRAAGVVYDAVTSYAAVTDSLGQWELLDEGFGLGINGSGQVVGYADGAALWDAAGNLTRLPLPEGALFSQAVGANDAGYIVGECWLGTTQISNYIAVWVGGGTPTMLGEGCGNAVNSSGTVAGFVKDAGGAHQAFVWTPAGGMTTLAGGVSSEANAINDSGQVAGMVCDGAGTWACVWSPTGSLTLLANMPGAISSTAYGINSSGAVVGSCDTADGTFAVLWQPNGALVSLGWLAGDVGGVAYGVNDAGQIAGCSLDCSGEPRAVVWDPIPEPASVLVVVAGLVALAPRLRRGWRLQNVRNVSDFPNAPVHTLGNLETE
jgi:uncharacterized membrane protein